jgi:serine protease Do
MKQYLLKAAGLAAVLLSLQSAGFAQTGEDRDTLSDKFGNDDEIVIKPKTGKDVTVTVEIKDGQVFIDGKPVDKFVDSAVSVHKKKMMVMDGRTITVRGFDNPGRFDEDMRPLYKSGGWSFDGENANGAFLGISSVKAEGNTEGAKVKKVEKGSAAEKAGLKEGDLITRVGEVPISDPQDLSDAIHKYKPQDKVSLTYKREGKEQKTTATLGKADATDLFNLDRNYNFDYNFKIPPIPPIPPIPAMPPAFSWNDGRPKLGIKAQDLEEGKGARVLGVDDQSPAGKAGVKEGDIITRFDGKDVDNASMLADLARETVGKPSIKIDVTRDGKTREIEVKVPKKLKTADL